MRRLADEFFIVERHVGIKAYIRRGDNLWIVGEAGIFACIFDDKNVPLKDRMTTEGVFSTSFAGQCSDARLEPFSVSINDGDGANWHVQLFDGAAGKPIKAFIRGRIENAQRPDG